MQIGIESVKPAAAGRTFTATMEPVTKTDLDNLSPVWTEGDSISVFDANGTNFKFIASGTGSSVSFTQSKDTPGELAGDEFYAVYPYSDALVFNSGSVTLSTPLSHTVMGKAFTSARAAVMTAHTTGDELNFKNLCSLISFTIPEGLGVTELYIYAAGQLLAGTVTATIASDGTPTASAPTDGDGINLVASEGTIAAGTYYMPVIPGSYSNIRVKLTYAEAGDHNVTVSDAFSLNAFTAARNKVNSIGTLYDTRSWFKWLTFEDGNVPGTTILSSDRAGTFTVAENPVKNSDDSSDNVLKQAIGSGSTSGFFTILFSKINSSILGRATSFKLNICLATTDNGGNKYFPQGRFNGASANHVFPARINGISPAGDTFTKEEMLAAYKWDGWNVIEFDASQIGKSSFADISSFMVRPAVWSTGSNGSGPLNLYYDNFGFGFDK
ncbi:MAG: hypothetical protein KBS55_04160 [Bacteroidales bacterium]|nr:hypothetical protein [Candidatus Cryptobacteroides aphodequi]